MPRRTSKASPTQSPSAKKPRTRGVNLKDLGRAISPESLTEGLQKLAADVPLALQPGKGDPGYTPWYWGIRALEVVLVAAAGPRCRLNNFFWQPPTPP